VRDCQNKIVRSINFDDVAKPKRQYYFIRYAGNIAPVGAFNYGYEFYRTMTGAEEEADEINWKHGNVMEILDRRLNVLKTVGTERKGVIQQDIEDFIQHMMQNPDDESFGEDDLADLQ